MSGGIMKVAVLGAAGGIGQPLSLLLKVGLHSGSVLALNDIASFTPGVAADLSHISTPARIVDIRKVDIASTLEGADIVLIPAGVPRKDEKQTRAELFNVNAGIVQKLAQEIARYCPKAIIGLITNPVNSTVPIVAEVLKQQGVYDCRKLFGITTLDVVRSEAFLAEVMKTEPANIKVNVVGGHSGKTILPLLSQVAGLTLTAAEAESLTTRIQNAGTEVVAAKGGTGSATLSMAYAAARFCFSVARALRGEKGIVECAYIENNQYDTKYFATPVRLGTEGVDEILPLGSLNVYEQKVLSDMISVLVEDVKMAEEFIAKGAQS
jgi:malate dehydrogenase